MCNYFFKYLEHKENSKSVEIYKSNEGDVFCFKRFNYFARSTSIYCKEKK